MNGRLPPDIAAAVALGGEAGATFAAFDWEHHPLGAVTAWPAPVRTVVAVALASRFPVVLWLGDELTMVYNDGYIPMLADKHPWAMGRPGLEVWWEIRDIIEPMLAGVVETGVATWSDDLLLMLVERGRPTEKYFTFTYSPIFLEQGKVGGVFCAVAETTERVLGERRLRVLNTLGAALVDAKSLEETTTATVAVCAQEPADLPFVALYLGDGDRQPLRASSSRVSSLLAAAAPLAAFWADGADAPATQTVSELAARLPGLRGEWGDGCPEQALVQPLADPGSGQFGTVVIGLNPHRPLDEQYRGFCRLLADQVEAGVANAVAHEAERARAESLAELDRAKTLFLTNVSHEFRTPLTLMLGPVEEALVVAGDDPDLRRQLEMVQRNGRRLLRLVNSLLDFARIEAGRASPQLVELDVGELTADIASAFADVCRRAGLDLVLDCRPSVGQVDPDMWETIVLNLLSNAFKFTFAGSISVGVVPGADRTVALSVSDTGVGIPDDERSRIFDRFYRPSNVEGRSMEGSGVGLALVRNLVELHGGTISVVSQPGVGTTFAVIVPALSGHSAVPLGTASRPRRDDTYVTEAALWLEGPNAQSDPQTEAPAVPVEPAWAPERPLVLVADDNPDLRAHLERIIGSRWSTVGAADGRQALELARRLEPDLVVADVMMPKLDGFELIKAMRADPRLEPIPVMVLSARAGAEAAAEGFDAGADDYLLKPFRSTDLLNRVAARLKVAARDRERREREQSEMVHASVLADLGARLAAATSETQIVEGLLGPALSSLGLNAVGMGVLEDGLLRMTFGGGLDRELTDRYHVMSVDAPVPVARVAKTGKRMVVPDVDELEEAFAAIVKDAASSVRAAVIQPLMAADGTVAGALSLTWATPRQFSEAEIELLADVATITAQALERIERAERERRIAVALQDRLLEVGAHSVPAAIATTYRPASDLMRVGGDWYTVSTLGDAGKIALSVGDVVGHGLLAATVMSELRSALAVAALAAGDPGTVLDLLDTYARQVPGASCATTAYVLVDPSEGTLRYACAGHPYPLLVTPGGEVELLADGRRPPLDAASAQAGAGHGTAPLGPGSLLILYTDGLVERRSESIDVGLARLARCARAAAGKPVGEVCAELVGAMAAEGRYADDVVVLAFRPCGSTATSFVDSIPAQVSELPALRGRLRGWLAERDVDADTAYAVLLSIVEAVSNAIEHGNRFDPGTWVTLELFVSGDELSATVTDVGRWAADSADTRRLERRGRGLTLIHGLSEHVAVERTSLGTRVTMRHRLSGPGGRGR